MSEAEQVVNQKAQTKKEEPQEERQFEVRPKNTTKLQIRNLQFGTSKEDLHDLCRRFGTIVNCEVNKSSGFVTYAKADEAQLALSQLDAQAFRGYTLRVQYAREPLPSKDKKAEETPSTASTTTATTTTTSAAPVKKLEEKKLTFAQQQQLAKAKPQAPKQTFTQPKETPKQVEPEQTQTQNQNQQQQGKGKKKQQQQQQQQQPQKGQQQQQQPTELRTYKVSVEKTVINEGDKKEEGFTFSVNHQQYLDYIIPLLKDISSKKEQQEKGSK